MKEHTGHISNRKWKGSNDDDEDCVSWSYWQYLSWIISFLGIGKVHLCFDQLWWQTWQPKQISRGILWFLRLVIPAKHLGNILLVVHNCNKAFLIFYLICVDWTAILFLRYFTVMASLWNHKILWDLCFGMPCLSSQLITAQMCLIYSRRASNAW